MNHSALCATAACVKWLDRNVSRVIRVVVTFVVVVIVIKLANRATTKHSYDLSTISSDDSAFLSKKKQLAELITAKRLKLD